ncbi:hypothetical protein PybrP1_005921 [[Pythium] brassicae (nom. inval.)]|nr:hypothetical protein PybrP1_005921 [[Pythium] brassicae (nom. inval.)]
MRTSYFGLAIRTAEHAGRSMGAGQRRRVVDSRKPEERGPQQSTDNQRDASALSSANTASARSHARRARVGEQDTEEKESTVVEPEAAQAPRAGRAPRGHEEARGHASCAHDPVGGGRWGERSGPTPTAIGLHPVGQPPQQTRAHRPDDAFTIFASLGRDLDAQFKGIDAILASARLLHFDGGPERGPPPTQSDRFFKERTHLRVITEDMDVMDAAIDATGRDLRVHQTH